MQPNQRPPRVLPLAFLLIFIAVACVGSILLAADLQCSSDIEAWVPYYPDAETVSVEYDFVRPRAMGTTVVILQSSDDEETIRQFYRDNTLQLLDEERQRGLAATDWQVEQVENSDMYRIILFSSCGI